MRLSKEAVVAAMLKQEVAGQRVFYVFLKQKGYKNITPENMDKNQNYGIIVNTIIECKLHDSEGGGAKKAYQELYETIPTRLKQKGDLLIFCSNIYHAIPRLYGIICCHYKKQNTAA